MGFRDSPCLSPNKQLYRVLRTIPLEAAGSFSTHTPGWQGPKQQLRGTLPPSPVCPEPLTSVRVQGMHHSEKARDGIGGWRRHAPERSEWCMVGGAGLEP